MHASRYRLSIELFIIAIAFPLVLSIYQPRGALFASLWLMMIYAITILSRVSGTRWRLPSFDWAALRERALMLPMLRRFFVCALLLTAFTMVMVPERLLSFPQEKPLMWLMVMCLYPVLSVIPQEIVFRSFFFKRYAPLFKNPQIMIAASGMAFGLAHIALSNWIAVGLSAIGGIFFAKTYHTRPSLALVCLEHALYGCFLFTIGLGYFFYSGAPHKW